MDNPSQGSCGLPTSGSSILESAVTDLHKIPTLPEMLRGAFWTRRALFLCTPIIIAIAFSFSNYLPDWYADWYPTRQVRARFVVAIWLAAAVAMSFIFSIGTLNNILLIAQSAPQSLRKKKDNVSKSFWSWLRLSQRLSQVLLAAFVALFVAAFWPRAIVQDWTILITGIPLVTLISFCDYCMFKAYTCSNMCRYNKEELEHLKELHSVLGDSGRILIYVDVPILFGLLPITALKLYWLKYGAGLEAIYVLGFTGGAIAMHLVLGNLISLLFEYLDEAIFRKNEEIATV
jgi:hypothetical protein